jgi:hypothetical protein
LLARVALWAGRQRRDHLGLRQEASAYLEIHTSNGGAVVAR